MQHKCLNLAEDTIAIHEETVILWMFSIANCLGYLKNGESLY